MESKEIQRPDAFLRQLTVPVAAVVGIIVAAAWYVTWASSDTMMMLISPATIGSTDLGLFFALLVVMMVAMMLPSALPMALAYRGMTRLEGGRPVRPPDSLGTILFLIPYFVVWGGFGVLALFALLALGLMGSMPAGPLLFVPAATLVAAGAWQVTRTKEVCLSHCTSPAGFVMHHWRNGRVGAMRMGFRHALYCIGCCWLFMLVLFVTGAMSLLWMGGLSIAIFVEKIGWRPAYARRAIGTLLVLLGALLGLRGIAG